MGKRWGRYLKLRYWQIASAIAMILVVFACSNNIELKESKITQKPAPETSELNIWWEQGYNIEEDEAFRTVVNNWQNQTGQRVKLTFFTNDELITKVERAVQANQTPDLTMSLKGNQVLYPRLAWQDKLEDVSDLIEPIKDDYSEKILQAITYTNPRQGKTRLLWCTYSPIRYLYFLLAGTISFGWFKLKRYTPRLGWFLAVLAASTNQT